jgi:hypothetical protein
VVAASLAPYLIAGWLTPPGYHFTGFLVNPLDGFSYLAKMRQAAEGAWLLTMPYVSEPQQPAFIWPQYVLLGKFAALTGLPLILVYHGARIVTGLAMLGVLYAFLATVLADNPLRRTAFVLLSAGSGLSWLTSLWGFVGADATVQVSTTFHALLSNMHFPLATALMVLPFLLVLRGLPNPGSRPIVAGAGSGALLATVAPFLIVIQLTVGGAWSALLLATGRLSFRPRLLLLPALPMAIAAGLTYILWMNPAIRSWLQQTVNPPPTPAAFIVGYGVLLPFAVAGAIAVLHRVDEATCSRAGALLAAIWTIVGAVLIYLPFPWQRRLMEGYDIPLSILAALGLRWAVSSLGPAARRRITASAMALATMGTLWLAGASVMGSLALREPHYLPEADVRGLAWLEEHTTALDLVLASPTIGNVIPAYSDARVYWGHPWETPDADRKEERLLRFYARAATETERCTLAREAGASFVYWGPSETRLGGAQPSYRWLEPVYRGDPVIVYRVHACDVLAALRR